MGIFSQRNSYIAVADISWRGDALSGEILMLADDITQIILYIGILLLLTKPLGLYMACIYENKPCGLNRILGPLERSIYRLSSINPASEMTWQKYAISVLTFSAAGFIALYCLMRLQGILPLNPEHFPAVPSDLSFNTAVSFVTNCWMNSSPLGHIFRENNTHF